MSGSDVTSVALFQPVSDLRFLALRFTRAAGKENHIAVPVNVSGYRAGVCGRK